jgi:Uma2 family endonuclease
MSTLTFERLQEAIDLVCPVLYYEISKFINPGAIYYIKPQENLGIPEYIIVHPDDFNEVKAIITWRRLVSIKEWRPSFKPLPFKEENHESTHEG